ncbi:unnamed protein product [Amoebophrya sp. A25]|nr:unnamed protein product [Amoebophrya sp. A25]|eukprot:GSA25T00026513001.1
MGIQIEGIPWPRDWGCDLSVVRRYPALFVCLRSLLSMWFPDFYHERELALKQLANDLDSRSQIEIQSRSSGTGLQHGLWSTEWTPETRKSVSTRHFERDSTAVMLGNSALPDRDRGYKDMHRRIAKESRARFNRNHSETNSELDPHASNAASQLHSNNGSASSGPIRFWTEFQGIRTLPDFNSSFCETYVFQWGRHHQKGQESKVEHLAREECPVLRSLASVMALSENLQHQGREAMKSAEYMKSRDVFVGIFLANFFGKGLWESQSYFQYTGWPAPFTTFLLVQLFDCVGWESSLDEHDIDREAGAVKPARIAVTDPSSQWMGGSFRIRRREQLVTGFGSSWSEHQTRLVLGATPDPVEPALEKDTSGATTATAPTQETSKSKQTGAKLQQAFADGAFTTGLQAGYSQPRTPILQFSFLQNLQQTFSTDAGKPTSEEATFVLPPLKKDFVSIIDTAYTLFLLDEYQVSRSLPTTALLSQILQDLLGNEAHEGSSVRTRNATEGLEKERDNVAFSRNNAEEEAGQRPHQLKKGRPFSLLRAHLKSVFGGAARRYILFYDSMYGRDWLQYAATLNRKRSLERIFNTTMADLFSRKNYEAFSARLVTEAARYPCPAENADMTSNPDVGTERADHIPSTPQVSKTIGAQPPFLPKPGRGCWALRHHLSPFSMSYMQSLRTSQLPSLLVFENAPLRETNWRASYSRRYWDSRYVAGGHSGSGSYGEAGRWKAAFLDRWFNSKEPKQPSEKPLTSVLELGVGDGAQLRQAQYPFWIQRFVGVDVSPFVVHQTRSALLADGRYIVSSRNEPPPRTRTEDTTQKTADISLEGAKDATNKVRHGARNYAVDLHSPQGRSENFPEIRRPSSENFPESQEQKAYVEIYHDAEFAHVFPLKPIDDDHDAEFAHLFPLKPIDKESGPKNPTLEDDGRFDVTLSMDVLYHLVEDDVYNSYIADLFGRARRYVIIFKHTEEHAATLLQDGALPSTPVSDHPVSQEAPSATDHLKPVSVARLERQHVRQRADLPYISKLFGSSFHLVEVSEANPLGKCKFYIFQRVK